MEQEGEVEMTGTKPVEITIPSLIVTDAPKTTKSKTTKPEAEKMELDDIY